MGSKPNPGVSGKHLVWELPESLSRLARGGDAWLVAEILEDFCQDGRARLSRLRHAAASQDAATVKLEAHSLKGSAAQMGAEGLATGCRALELSASAGLTGGVEAQLDAIEALLEETCRAIARHPLCAK